MGTLKPSQTAALREDLAAAEEALTSPNMAPYIQDKAALRLQAKQLKQTLEEQAPKPYETAVEQDAAAKRERELRGEILQGIPSQEEMRRKRSDSVHKHMTWEKANKTKILEWREIVKRLEPESDDPNLTSIEKYRPSMPYAYDPNDQIAGHHAMTPAAKENWPLGEPKAETAVKHLKEPKGK
jgi:hypothetical protein